MCIVLSMKLKKNHTHNNYVNWANILHVLELILLGILCSVGVQAGINLVVVQHKVIYPSKIFFVKQTGCTLLLAMLDMNA